MAKANRTLLTDKNVLTLAVPASGQAIYWDSVRPGLGVRVTAAGSRVYVVQGQCNSKSVRVTLKPCDELSIDDARAQARAAIELMRSGTNPVEKKRAHKVASQTLHQVLEEYIETRRTAFGSLRPSTVKKYREHVNVHCADWRDKAITEITHTMIAARFKKISTDAPVQGNIVMGTLRTLFNYVRDRSINSEGVPTVCTHNPVVIAFKGLARYNHVKPRTRRIPTNKIGAVVHLLYQRMDSAAFTLNDNHNAALTLALLFSGARFSEMATLKWADVQLDADEPCYTFRETKMHRVMTFGIPTHLMALFRLQWERRLTGNPYVFIGRTRKTHIKSPYCTLKLVSDAAGCKISAHDLRRTFTQSCETVGLQNHVTELLTSHQPSSVTGRHYRESENLIHYVGESQKVVNYFVQQRDIYQATLDGANVVQLTA